MIYAITYNDPGDYRGRVRLDGPSSKVLNEYRLITRVMCDRYGADRVLEWTVGLAKDDLTSVNIEGTITPDQGGEYIPEEVKSIEQT